MKLPGNVAVVVNGDTLTAKATGPLGGELGRYENGAYRSMQSEVLFLDPVLLRGVLAGVWRGGMPAVAGADAGDGLLRWRTADGVAAEGVLDVAGARLRSLSVRGPGGELSVEFSGAFDPWPSVVVLTDRPSGRSLKLRRVASESIAREPPDLESPKARI